jgi:hypothetical protein
VAGGVLLRGAPAGALAEGAHLQFRNQALDPELLLVGLAQHAHHVVARQRQASRLQQLLQQGLRVLALGPGIELGQQRIVQTLHHGCGGLEAAVQEYRAQHRLQGVGEN